MLMAFAPLIQLPESAWSILMDLPVAVYIKDSKCRFVWLNTQAAAAIGANSSADAVGTTDANYFEPAIAAEWEREEREIIRTGVAIMDRREQEQRIGAKVPISTVITCKLRFEDQSGNFGIIGVSKSINREQALIQRAELAIAGAQVGLWHSDLRSDKVWYSPRWKEILGYSDAELDNTPDEFWTRVHPEDEPKIRVACDAHFADSRTLYECEFRMLHKSGEWRWIRSRGKALLTDGEPVEFAGSHNDITSYRHQNELHEAILEMLPVLVFLKNEKLEFAFANNEIARFFNRRKEEIIGVTDARINPNHEQVEKFQRDDQMVLASQPTDPPLIIETEFLIDQQKKENRILKTQKKLLLYPSGNPKRHILGISTDITVTLRALEEKQAAIQAEKNKLGSILTRFTQAVQDVEQAENEEDACTTALLHLDEFALTDTPSRKDFANVKRQCGVMMSFLRTKQEKPYVEAVHNLATGVFSKVVNETKSPMFIDERKLDILPWVLQHGKSEFIADSRTHPRCDRKLATQHKIVAQLVIPLQTRSLKIGTLQIALGDSQAAPDERGVYEAFAANLSSTIERHRRIAQLAEKNRQLLSASQLAAYNAAGTAVIHGLKRDLSHYRLLLDRTEKDRIVRSCVPAMDFLKDSRRFADGWVQSFAEQLISAKTTPEDNYVNVYELLKEVAEHQIEAHALGNCKLDWQSSVEKEIYVPGSQLFLREMLAALIVNAVDAHAKKIDISARVFETILPSGGLSRRYAQIRITDDGDGIAIEYQDQIGRFGWTSKKKRGHGVGLTIVSTFAEALEGGLFLRSGGKSVGEPNTVFELLLPIANDKP